MKTVIVWVLVMATYRTSLTVIDNIADKQSCERAAAVVEQMKVYYSNSPDAICVPVRKVVLP